MKNSIQLLLNALGYFVLKRATMDRLRDRLRELEAEVGEREDGPGLICEHMAKDGDFGDSDFSDLAWLFKSEQANFYVIHQRFSEAALPWRGVRMSAGPILEIGRAAGGTTVLLLGGSGTRPVVSIDLAGIHHPHSDEVFARPDVARRLRLYDQSSREPIEESAFGFLFVDGDHSYDGVCTDIANYWNALASFDCRPAYCYCHDAGAGESLQVASVKAAVDELIAEPGACRVVDTAGSAVLLEKTGEIDAARWKRKIDSGFWAALTDDALDEFEGDGTWTRVVPPLHAALDEENLIRAQELVDDRWNKIGISFGKAGSHVWGDDNRIYYIAELNETGEHFIEYQADAPAAAIAVSAFLRPANRCAARLCVVGQDGAPLAYETFRFLGDRGILAGDAVDGAGVLGSRMEYATGFFGCHMMVRLPTEQPPRLRIQLLGQDMAAVYPGREGYGALYLNSVSMRRIRA